MANLLILSDYTCCGGSKNMQGTVVDVILDMIRTARKNVVGVEKE